MHCIMSEKFSVLKFTRFCVCKNWMQVAWAACYKISVVCLVIAGADNFQRCCLETLTRFAACLLKQSISIYLFGVWFELEAANSSQLF